jgi:hypothetical protein
VLSGTLIWASVVAPDQPASAESGGSVTPVVTKESSPASAALAIHLTTSGAVMYSAYWCPYSHEQKEMFGKEAVQQLKIVECADDGQNHQADLCLSKGLKGFPSWEINGEIDMGVNSLDSLADLSGYKGNREF